MRISSRQDPHRQALHPALHRHVRRHTHSGRGWPEAHRDRPPRSRDRNSVPCPEAASQPEKPSKPKLVSRKGPSPRLHLSAGPVAQSPVEMPTTSLNCKVRSDNVKSIQNPTSMKSSFPVPPILTSTPPSHRRDKVSSTDSVVLPGTAAPCSQASEQICRPAVPQARASGPRLQASSSYQEGPPVTQRLELAHTG